MRSQEKNQKKVEIPHLPSIGENVRKERLSRNFSLDELSGSSGVSKSMLSQIESGKVNPTVATAWKIAHALSVDFNALLRGKAESLRRFEVNRREDITILDTNEEDAHIQVLSPISMAEDLELYLLTIKGKGALHSQAHYAGTEEYLTVLEGKIKVTAGSKSSTLEAGDVLLYQCDTAHSIENLGSKTAKIYLVVRFFKQKNH